MAELRNQIAPERRGRLFGLFGATMGTAAAIGPLLGDVLIDAFGWHSVFLVNLPIIILSLVLEPPHRKGAEEPSSRRKLNFDFVGSLLFAVAVALVVGGVQAKSHYGWLAFGAGIVMFILFAQYERRTPEPLLDPKLFSLRSFTVGSSIVALQNFAMYAVLFLVPFLLHARQPGAKGAGTFLLAMTGAMVLASPLGGRLADSAGSRVVTLIGAVVAMSGAAMLILTNGGTTKMLFAALALLGAGIGFATSPSQASAMSAVPRASAGVAAGALSTMRYIGGVLGSGVVGVIIVSSADTPLLWIFPAALLASACLALLLPAAGQEAVEQ
jgi:MFS family permease